MSRIDSLSRRLIPVLLGSAALTPALAQEQVLRFGVSDSLLQDLNPSDARAAITVWIRRITSDLAVNANFDQDLFVSPSRLQEKLRAGLLDAVGISILDYPQMASLLDTSQIAVPSFRERFEYVLLTSATSPAKDVAALRASRLLMLDSVMASAASAWLATLLEKIEPHGPAAFFTSLAKHRKPSQVILPVFFNQAAACLTTRSSFVTISELNPQVAARLRPLAVSPEIVPLFYAFRRGWSGSIRQKALQSLLANHTAASAAGRTPWPAAGLLPTPGTFQGVQMARGGPPNFMKSLSIVGQAVLPALPTFRSAPGDFNGATP